MYEYRNDPRWLVIEVYDHSKPATRIEMAAIEVLPPWESVRSPMIRMRYSTKDQLHLVHQIRPAKR